MASYGAVLAFVVIAASSLLTLVPGGERFIVFNPQDFQQAPTSYSASSTTFQLWRGESARDEIYEEAYNSSNGATIWRGYARGVFLLYAANQTGPTIDFRVAPRDGYYMLEVHHNDCGSEVVLCQVPASELAFRTSGSIVIRSPPPFDYLTDSASIPLLVASVAGIGTISGWFQPLLRSAKRGTQTPSGHPASPRWVLVLLVASAVVLPSVAGLQVNYQSEVVGHVGGSGFAGPCAPAPGQVNQMQHIVIIFNGADTTLTIQFNILIGNTTYQGGAITLPPSAEGSTLAFTPSRDCVDRGARIDVLWASPAVS